MTHIAKLDEISGKNSLEQLDFIILSEFSSRVKYVIFISSQLFVQKTICFSP